MKSFSQKKICLLYAGGISTDNSFNETALNKWLDGFFELQMMAKVVPKFIYQGTGAEISWDLASKLSQSIKENYDQYDGFVITHGADNIVYTSGLLSFMVQNTGKPIIFTRFANPEKESRKSKIALFSSEFKDLTIKTSLINAVQIATSDIAEIGILANNILFKAISAPADSLHPITNKTILAKIQFGIHSLTHSHIRNNQEPKFNFKYNSDIKIAEIYPGSQPIFTEKKYAGIFIKGLHEQGMPSSWILPKDTPICVYGSAAKESGSDIIYCQGLTVAAAITKFIWCLGQTKDIKPLQKLMAADLAGEYYL